MMRKTSLFNAVGDGLARAANSLLTKQLFYGVAVSCAIGVGVGLWLQPPRLHLGRQPDAIVPAPAFADTPDLGESVAAPQPATASAATPPPEVAETMGPPELAPWLERPVSSQNDEPAAWAQADRPAQTDYDDRPGDADEVEDLPPPRRDADRPPPPGAFADADVPSQDGG
jgi:hypothetical protein